MPHLRCLPARMAACLCMQPIAHSQCGHDLQLLPCQVRRTIWSLLRQATEDLYQTLDERRQLLLALADRGALLAPGGGDEPAQQLGRTTSAAAALDRQVCIRRRLPR